MIMDEENTKKLEPDPTGDASLGAVVGRFGAAGPGRGILAPDEEIDLS